MSRAVIPQRVDPSTMLLGRQDLGADEEPTMHIPPREDPLDRGIAACGREADKLLDAFCHQAHWTQLFFEPTPAQFDHWVRAIAMYFVVDLLTKRPTGQRVAIYLSELCETPEGFPLRNVVWAAAVSLMIDIAFQQRSGRTQAGHFKRCLHRSLRSARQWFREALRAWHEAGNPLEDFYPPVPELRFPEPDAEA